MDILPACMPNSFDKENIKIPEKALKDWSLGNPKGFANWFLNIANSVEKPMLREFSTVLLEAKVETEPLPEELYFKSLRKYVINGVNIGSSVQYNSMP